MLITTMAQKNFLGDDLPAKMFRKIDYDAGFETPDDQVMIGELLKTINQGKVVIDKPYRINIGEHRLQYNFVREYRPKRAARIKDVRINEPFNPSKFNFSVDICEPGVFDSIRNGGDSSIDLLLNRYPFAPYHFLWVPNRKDGQHNQYLDPQKDSHIIEAMWQFVSKSGLGDNIRFGYNSNGAHASVNHLHFQGFFVTDDWAPPIDRIIHNSISPDAIDYFPGAKWISGCNGTTAVLKDFITEMNSLHEKEKDIAYNLYITPKGIACFPRKSQGNPEYFALGK